MQLTLDDTLRLDEQILALLGSIVEKVRREPWDTKGREQTQLVEKTKRVLSGALFESLSLQEIASLVYASPFHLTRSFTRHTGMPLHRYRTQLRLRASLGRLEEGEGPLKKLAKELGFSSHSHFSSRFSDAFAFTPTQWRQGVPGFLEGPSADRSGDGGPERGAKNVADRTRPPPSSGR